ncbi:MAG: RdgB/HAM1 family non-canonical purine NTP pyrophosphatase [Pseudomonadota bacterium]
MKAIRWVLATSNPGKIREFQAWGNQHEIELVPASEWNAPEVEEPYGTFLENALIKARTLSAFTGLPALADDSGLCVPALGGQPGVYSARFAGEPRNDTLNNNALIKALEGIKERSAYYYAVLVMCEHENDPQPLIAQGQWWGKILEKPEGEGGFGYDPLFYDDEMKLTAGQMSLEAKQQRSHRGQALAQLTQMITRRFNNQ